jgi:hypothetical protein
MDDVAFADARIALTAAMTAILLLSDSEEVLKKTFNACLLEAGQGYTDERNRILAARSAGMPSPMAQGTEVTRQQWMGMISKFLRVYGNGERGQKFARDFFEAMLKMACERIAPHLSETARQRSRL